MEGVCLKLHGTAEQKENLQEQQQAVSEKAQQQRRTRASRATVKGFVAGPANNARMLRYMNEGSASFAKRTEQKALKMIAESDDNKDLDRACLQRFANKGAVIRDGGRRARRSNPRSNDGESGGPAPTRKRPPVTVPTGGTSQASRKRLKAAAGDAINGVIATLASNIPEQADKIRKTGVEAAVQRVPNLTEPSSRSDGSPDPSTDEDDENDVSPADEVFEKTVSGLKQLLGVAMIKRIHSAKKASDRRPFLAIAAKAGFQRKMVAETVGVKISDHEWSEINKHAAHPGPWEPKTNAQQHKCRVPLHVLEAFAEFMRRPDDVQRQAFGRQVRVILGGEEYSELDNAARLLKVEDLAAKFIGEAVFSLLDEELQPEDASDRCPRMERGTFRQCLHCNGHDGSCKFNQRALFHSLRRKSW
jgi:hypothetical protein